VRLAAEIKARLSDAGLSHVKVVAGGIIPPEDEARLKSAGVAAVFSPKDYDLNAIMRELIVIATDDHEEKAGSSTAER
jgi:(2R)-ethylmalonyl-CoA mutase